MAMAIVTRRQQHSSGTRRQQQQSNADRQLQSQDGHVGLVAYHYQQQSIYYNQNASRQSQWQPTDLQMIQRGEGCSVGNGLDRGHVDVVVDVVNMPTYDALSFQVLLLKATPRWNTATNSSIQ